MRDSEMEMKYQIPVDDLRKVKRPRTETMSSNNNNQCTQTEVNDIDALIALKVS